MKSRSCPSRKPKSQGTGLGSNLARQRALSAPRREQMMSQGAGGLFGIDTRTAGEQAAAVAENLTHQKRMRDLEYQRVLLEIEALKKQTGNLSVAPTRAIDFALPKPVKSSGSILTGIGVFCDVTSASGHKTRMFYASACPIGATQVD